MAVFENRGIYVAYYKGEDIATGKPSFTEPTLIYASVGDVVSYENIDNIGRIPEYDRTLIVQIGELSEYLREDSRLWIDTIPDSTASNFDYTIARMGDEVNARVKVYCNAIAPNTQFLYYCNDSETIYQVKVFYKDLVAIAPSNMYLPIDASSLVWSRKPSSVDTTTALIKLTSTKTRYKTKVYTFEEVE